MADFSFLSDDGDSDTEKAVNELLSQAMDQSVLEQVAAINCSGFTDSVLPTQLETRFRKLKSLPTNPKPSNFTTNSKRFSSSELPKNKKIYDDDNEKIKGNPDEDKGFKDNLERGFDQVHKNDVFKETPDGKKGFLKVNLEDGSDQEHENDVFLDGKKGFKVDLDDGFDQELKYDVFKETPKAKSSSLSRSMSFSPSDSWNFSKAKIGCLWCKLKKGFSKKGKENRGSVSMRIKWGKNDDDEFLSDLSTFSCKNQDKLMKKAMMEQEKINREAEKIVKWAKQASARMDVSSIEDELSDDEIFK